jgi:hypothetical protein
MTYANGIGFSPNYLRRAIQMSYPSASQTFQSAIQFLERQSIATHTALLDKKSARSSKKKKIFLFITEYSFTKKLS